MDRKNLKLQAKETLRNNKCIYLYFLAIYAIIMVLSMIPVLSTFSFVFSIVGSCFLIGITMDATKEKDINISNATKNMGKYVLTYLL